MKTLLLLGISIGLAGCAQTTVFRNGQPILKTQANAKLLVFQRGDTYLRIEGLNHSTPTRAGGSVIGTGLSGVAGIATVVATKGLVH